MTFFSDQLNKKPNQSKQRQQRASFSCVDNMPVGGVEELKKNDLLLDHYIIPVTTINIAVTHHHHHHLFWKRHFFHAKLGLDVCPYMKSLNISLKTAHSGF